MNKMFLALSSSRMKAAVAMPSNMLSKITDMLARALIISSKILGAVPFLFSGGRAAALGTSLTVDEPLSSATWPDVESWLLVSAEFGQ